MTQQRISLWGLSVCLLTLLLSASPAFAQKMSGDNTNIDQDGDIGVKLNNLLAGERLQGSATNSYLVVRQEATATIITGTTAVTLGGGMPGDTHLMMLHIHTALTGTCVIEGFRDPAGNAETYILPAATIGKIDFMGAINDSGALAVTCSNAGDNKKVIAMWRPR